MTNSDPNEELMMAPSIPAPPSLKKMSSVGAGGRSRPRAGRRRVLAVKHLKCRTLLAHFGEFPLLTPGGAPREITSGPDGNLWFTEFFANTIGMINPTTHAITEFALPSAQSVLSGITLGLDRKIWFTESGGNRIGQVLVSTPPEPTGRAVVRKSRGAVAAVTFSFNVALDPDSARTAALYGANASVKKKQGVLAGKPLRIKAVTFNAGANTVTLTLARPFKGPVQVAIHPGLKAADGEPTTLEIVRIVR
jgi:hypothetical protein